MEKDLKEVENNFKYFREILKKLENPKNAQKEKVQLKSPDKFYGAPHWKVSDIVKEFRKRNPTLEKDKLLKLVSKLWNSNYYEEKTIAVKLLEAYSSYLSLKDMEILEYMLSHSRSCFHVEEISCLLVNAVLAKNKKAYSYLHKWSVSDNLWLKKASVISQTKK